MFLCFKQNMSYTAILLLILGIVLVVGGSNYLVDGASDVARRSGISEFVIGLTIVGIGTSLPEMVVSFISAFQGSADMAIGNVIGSNIFNIFLILGCASVIHPLPFGGIGNFDLLTLTAASALFWLFAVVIRRRTITRLEGALLAATYVGYIAYLLANI